MAAANLHFGSVAELGRAPLGYARRMCGRFTQAVPWSAVWAFSQPLTIALPPDPLVPRYNIAPTHQAWVLASDGRGGAKAGRMRWGLVPNWARDIKSSVSTFNARLESASSKPTFREAFKRRHCIVPAGGYYEWTGEGKAKQPWYIYPERAPLLFFAGIWDRWAAPSGDSLLSFSILTTAAEGAMATLHHRQPVMLSPQTAAQWLSPAGPDSIGVLTPPAEHALRWYKVGGEVGSTRNDSPSLIAPAGDSRQG